MDTQYIFIRCIKAENLPSNLSSCCLLSCDCFWLLFFLFCMAFVDEQWNYDFSMLENQYVAELPVQSLSPPSPLLSVKWHWYSAHKVVLWPPSASKQLKLETKQWSQWKAVACSDVYLMPWKLLALVWSVHLNLHFLFLLKTHIKGLQESLWNPPRWDNSWRFSTVFLSVSVMLPWFFLINCLYHLIEINIKLVLWTKVWEILLKNEINYQLLTHLYCASVF